MAARCSLPSLEQASQARGDIAGGLRRLLVTTLPLPHSKIGRQAAKIPNCAIGTSEIKLHWLFRGDSKIQLELSR
jgi:hypothetical protein